MNFRLIKTLALASLALPLLVACSDSESSSLNEDAEITRFIINNDSIEAIDNVYLTIDDDKGLIYNADSLAYGTRIDSVFAYIYGYKLSSVVINDSITYSDSLAIDFTNPIKLRSYAADINFYKDYTVQVNVHQVDPELFIWNGILTQLPNTPVSEEKAIFFNETMYYYSNTSSSINLLTSVNGTTWSAATTNLPYNTNFKEMVEYNDNLAVVYNEQLYTSTDGKNWSVQVTTGETVDHLLFTLNGYLYGLSGTSTSANIVRLNSSNSWEVTIAMPTDFPINGAAMCVAPSATGIERAYLIGGVSANNTILNSVWSTENGSYWANLTPSGNGLQARTGAAVIQYADGLMLFGGRDENGVISQNITYSPDYGLNWFAADKEMQISDLYVPRYGASVLINSDNILYLIGGQTTPSTFVSNVWKGYQYKELPGFKN